MLILDVVFSYLTSHLNLILFILWENKQNSDDNNNNNNNNDNIINDKEINK
jgi:hypothetical protein